MNKFVEGIKNHKSTILKSVVGVVIIGAGYGLVKILTSRGCDEEVVENEEETENIDDVIDVETEEV